MAYLFGVFPVQTEVLTGADLVNPSLKGGTAAKRGKAAVVEEEEVVVVVEEEEEEEGVVAAAVSEDVEEEVETEPPSFLQRSWMPSWMHTMQRYLL